MLSLKKIGFWLAIWGGIKATWDVIGHIGNVQTLWDMISAAVQYWPGFLRGALWVVTSWWFPLIASTICLFLWWHLSRKEKKFAAVTFEDATIAPIERPEEAQILRHHPGIDQKVAQWIAGRFPRRVVLMDDRYYFGFEVQVPQSHLRVMIRRIKNRPEHITILNRIGITDAQRTKLKTMSDEARESLLKAINLEASRLKIEPHFVQDFRYACIHHDILITEELTESRLMDGVNNVKFAHSVIHHTINNLLTPTSVPSEQSTVSAESRELKARKEKLKNLLAKKQRLATAKSSPGFDMDEARRRNERFIAEVQSDISRLENEQKL